MVWKRGEACTSTLKKLGLQERFCKSRIFNSKIPIASTKDSSTISEKEAPSWRRIVAQQLDGKTWYRLFNLHRYALNTPKWIAAPPSHVECLELYFATSHFAINFLWRYSFLCVHWRLKFLVKLEPCCLEYFYIAPKWHIGVFGAHFQKALEETYVGFWLVEHGDIKRAHNLSYVNVFDRI